MIQMRKSDGVMIFSVKRDRMLYKERSWSNNDNLW